jgi:3-oxosteroid 1-dehydrogenase
MGKSNMTTAEMKSGRRQFLQVAAAGAVASGFTASVAPAAPAASAKWDKETDVVVVGSGSAAAAAASKALDLGVKVIVLEKASVWGGTTAKSGAWYWIPNNSWMRAQGLTDPREDAIRYMARTGYPTKYRADALNFGLSELEYQLLATFYDRGSTVVDDLARMGALQSQLVGSEAFPVFDYGSGLPENKAPQGRALQPKDGRSNGGAVMTKQMREFIASKGGEIFLKHRVVDAITNPAGEVIGVKVTTPDGEKRVRARRGVVFGSGGFTHNLTYRQTYLKGPVFGGCAVPTCEGDLIPIAMSLGTAFGNMTNAWWAECVVEDALVTPSFGQTLFLASGRGMVYVNRLGRRVVDEHMMYNERTQAHFIWDPDRYEYINRILFMIFDDADRQRFAGIYPIPASDGRPAYLIQADTLEALASAIDERLRQIAPKVGSISLDAHFNATLRETLRKFAEYAKSGVDPEFRRDSNATGRTLAGINLHKSETFEGEKKTTSFADMVNPDLPHDTMRAMSDKGPFYAILVGGGTLDTKGGPVINTDAQMLSNRGQPITGLYGAGNCIASPAGASYFAGGCTIGLALTYGYIAGENAARAPVHPA